MTRRVHIIVNPASGREEPVLSYLNSALHKTDITWSLEITYRAGDAFRLVKQALRKKPDVIAVYGGDGTVMEAARALMKKKTPMLIIPGGTANVLAKELGIPVDTKQAVNLITKRRIKTKIIDMALCDGIPFVIRVNAGIFAHLVTKASRTLKNQLGQAAYGVTAMQEILHTDRYTYKMRIDDKQITERGVALMIANAGNVGVTGFSMLPNINVTDGMLDVILFKYANMSSLYSWIKSLIFQQKPRGTVRHWKAKKVVLTVHPKHALLCDDTPLTKQTITAKILPRSLTVVVP